MVIQANRACNPACNQACSQVCSQARQCSNRWVSQACRCSSQWCNPVCSNQWGKRCMASRWCSRECQCNNQCTLSSQWCSQGCPLASRWWGNRCTHNSQFMSNLTTARLCISSPSTSSPSMRRSTQLRQWRCSLACIQQPWLCSRKSVWCPTQCLTACDAMAAGGMLTKTVAVTTASAISAEVLAGTHTRTNLARRSRSRWLLDTATGENTRSLKSSRATRDSRKASKNSSWKSSFDQMNLLK